MSRNVNLQSVPSCNIIQGKAKTWISELLRSEFLVRLQYNIVPAYAQTCGCMATSGVDGSRQAYKDDCCRLETMQGILWAFEDIFQGEEIRHISCVLTTTDALLDENVVCNGLDFNDSLESRNWNKGHCNEVIEFMQGNRGCVKLECFIS